MIPLECPMVIHPWCHSLFGSLWVALFLCMQEKGNVACGLLKFMQIIPKIGFVDSKWSNFELPRSESGSLLTLGVHLGSTIQSFDMGKVSLVSLYCHLAPASAVQSRRRICTPHPCSCPVLVKTRETKEKSCVTGVTGPPPRALSKFPSKPVYKDD